MPRSKPLAAWMLVAGLMFGPAPRLHAAAPDWRDAQLSPDRRAALAAAAMTLDEKLALLKGSVAFRWIRDGAEVRWFSARSGGV